MILSNHFILSHSLLLCFQSFRSIRIFSNEFSLRIRWPKYWSFSFSIGTFNEYSGLISFRVDWFDLLAGQATPKSHLQHHNLKVLILQQYRVNTTFLCSRDLLYCNICFIVVVLNWTYNISGVCLSVQTSQWRKQSTLIAERNWVLLIPCVQVNAGLEYIDMLKVQRSQWVSPPNLGCQGLWGWAFPLRAGSKAEPKEQAGPV